MAKKIIFLSHIHEEKELALIIKSAIESEFSGFVEVFVSSDGTSIPAGSNFLKRIEDGLVECVGALCLISPISINRNWINFELGAVWIRSTMSMRQGGPEIPVLPICHSGQALATLPKPIDNLNSVLSNQSTGLEFAFRAIQNAVGGEGEFRTNFNTLAQEVVEFEKDYTLYTKIKRVLNLMDIDKNDFHDHCKKAQDTNITIKSGEYYSLDTIKELRELAHELEGNISLQVGSLSVNQQTNEHGQQVTLTLERISAIEATQS